MKTILKKIKRFFCLLVNKGALSRGRVKYGKGLYIRGKVFVKNAKSQDKRGSIVLGDNVTINSSRKANPIGGDTKTILYSMGGDIVVGDGVGISNSTIVSKVRVEIGKSTNIGANTKIYDTDFHSIDPDTRLNGDHDVKSKPVKIGKRVFVGAHSIILKGVTIGDGAVIGAGSVVTKDVPQGEVWAGNPARFIKKVVE